MARPGLPLLLTGAPAALVVGSALLLGLSGAGCRADPESRSVANEELGTVAVSDTLTLKVYPAAVATVTAAQVTLHASGARLALCASNTARQAAPLVVKLENLPPDLVLGCVAAQGSVCTVAGRLVEGEDGTGAVYSTEVPSGQSCPDGLAGPPTLVFRAANGAAAGPYCPVPRSSHRSFLVAAPGRPTTGNRAAGAPRVDCGPVSAASRASRERRWRALDPAAPWSKSWPLLGRPSGTCPGTMRGKPVLGS